MQLWCHLFRQKFHGDVNTNNYTESFNNILKHHYFILRNDKSVFSLVQLLLQHVFPDQEREYTELSARQTKDHRLPRDPYLHSCLTVPNQLSVPVYSALRKPKLLTYLPSLKKTVQKAHTESSQRMVNMW